jgi:HIRAN domain
MQTQHGVGEKSDASDDYACYEHFSTKIAGRWYNRHAEAWPGDEVLFVREPNNRADRNAIAILNPAGERIGYLSSQLAAEYVALIDLDYIRLKGSLLHCCDPDFDDEQEATSPTVEVWVEGSLSRLGLRSE